ncbi:hypothetical protein AAFH68_50110 [Flavobacterium sp. CGRL1]
MPEGPSILILKEEVQHFTGKKIIEVYGSSSIDMERLRDKTILSFKTWGKHFLICFEDFTVKIHMMMFGTYTINEKKGNCTKVAFRFF